MRSYGAGMGLSLTKHDNMHEYKHTAKAVQQHQRTLEILDYKYFVLLVIFVVVLFFWKGRCEVGVGGSQNIYFIFFIQ